MKTNEKLLLKCAMAKKYYRYIFVNTNNEKKEVNVYASSWKKAQEIFEKENTNVKEIIRATAQ